LLNHKSCSSGSSHLFASTDAIVRLENIASKINDQGLLALFPNLVVAVIRIAPAHDMNRYNSENTRPDWTRRHCYARIYQPIKPSDFMTDIVFGTGKRLVDHGEELLYFARPEWANVDRWCTDHWRNWSHTFLSQYD
jgi:hypothetical protein